MARTLERVQVLPATHVSEDTAYLVDGYPYSRTLRCKIRYWVETGTKGAGKDRQRWMSQTCNPKNGRWNNPRASTYNDMTIMFLDENHVQAWGIDTFSISGINDARLRARGVYDQMTDEQRKRYDVWLAVSKRMNPNTWADWNEQVRKVAAHLRDTGTEPETVNSTWKTPDGTTIYLQDDGQAHVWAARQLLAEDTTPADPTPDHGVFMAAADGEVVQVASVRHVDITPADPETTERFSAAWTDDGEVTVIRDIHAGISGPFGDYPAADRQEAETVLRANGYALTGPWTEHVNGWFAPLVRVAAGDGDDDGTAAMAAAADAMAAIAGIGDLL